jgi:hypothetical protein
MLENLLVVEIPWWLLILGINVRLSWHGQLLHQILYTPPDIEAFGLFKKKIMQMQLSCYPWHLYRPNPVVHPRI